MGQYHLQHENLHVIFCLPVQVMLSDCRTYPLLQEQLNVPGSLLHIWEQPLLLYVHSSMSKHSRYTTGNRFLMPTTHLCQKFVSKVCVIGCSFIPEEIRCKANSAQDKWIPTRFFSRQKCSAHADFLSLCQAKFVSSKNSGREKGSSACAGFWGIVFHRW